MYNNQIKIFLCVADCGSFAKAAARLFLSTTAVMKQMNLLEKNLSLQLFNRTNQGVQLTAAGNSLYKDAQFIVKYSQEAIERAHQALHDSQQIVRIGSSILNPCTQLLELWSKISHLYPHIKIQIVPFEDDHSNILSVLDTIGHEFDIIVAACSSPEWLNRAKFCQLGYFDVCCAVSRSHKLSKKSSLQISDLFDETLMMVPQTISPHLDVLRAEIKLHYPQIKIEDTSYFYDIHVFNRCEQTSNILLTLDAWKDVHFSLVTIPVNWNYHVPYGLLYQRNPSSAVTQFIDILTNYQ